MGAAGWWSSFFEGPALELWRRAHSEEENRAQAEDVARALGIGPGTRVLDVPCGNGRLALELAARGARVTGVDLAAEFVAEGRARARERGLEVELVQGDVRELAWTAEFDAAFCAGNSFGYFEDEDNRAFLRGVARALRPGGRFLLEYPMVAELVLPRGAFRNWALLGERLMLSDARYDERRRRLDTTYTFADLATAGGALESRAASYQVYTAREVEELLREAGFTAVELLDSLAVGPFEPGSTGWGEFQARATR